MYDEMVSLMAGRASEEIKFGKISTGALNDIERATKMAQSMVVYYGMSPEIGNISFYDSSGQSDWNFTKPFSEKTAELIDKEVRRIVESAYAKAKELILSHREQLDELAGKLYDKEVLFREDLERIYGPRPWDEAKKIENESSKQLTEGSEEVKEIAENNDQLLKEEQKTSENN